MDEATFDSFYESSYRGVVAHVYAMCGNITEAQDCAQEAFVRAWAKRQELDHNRSPEAWVRTVAYRLAVSRWRKARQSFRHPDRALEDRRAAQPSPDRVALMDALSRITPEQRHVVVLHHLFDLSVAEIADELGAPPGTVKARLSRGRAALATFLTDSQTETSHA